ncbi:MAG: dihydroneopterin triphosphate diphosphatase [Burkholderiaceae bacterium]|jgi:dATP pyrophosphohydrolase
MSFKFPESVLVVIHTAARDVLLLERTDRPGYWQSVTGSRATPVEPFADTARRELFEETGIQARGMLSSLSDRFSAEAELLLNDCQHSVRFEIYPHWRHRYAPESTHNTEHWFSLCVPPPCPVQLSPHEHTRYRWLPWADAAAACFSPSNAQAIMLWVGGQCWEDR